VVHMVSIWIGGYDTASYEPFYEFVIASAAWQSTTPDFMDCHVTTFLAVTIPIHGSCAVLNRNRRIAMTD